jgi:hypothetical protein
MWIPVCADEEWGHTYTLYNVDCIGVTPQRLLAGERLVKAFAVETGISRDLRHAFGAGAIAYCLGGEAASLFAFWRQASR